MELLGASIVASADEKAMLVDVVRRSSLPVVPVPTNVDPVLTVLEGVRVVLFDVYGTLLVSGSGDVGTAKSSIRDALFADAVSAALGRPVIEAFGRSIGSSYFEVVDDDHAELRSRGVSHPEIDAALVWRRILTRHASDLGLTTVPDSLARLVAIEYEVRANPVWPMPQAAELLSALASEGFRLGIVSNAQYYTPLIFEALLGASPAELGIEDDLSSWSYRLGYAKPAPLMFRGPLETARAWGLAPQDIAYVGNDMLNDVWTAAEAGCRTCLFAGDERSLRLRTDRPECEGLVPDAVITDMAQLRRCLPDVRGME